MTGIIHTKAAKANIAISNPMVLRGSGKGGNGHTNSNIAHPCQPAANRFAAKFCRIVAVPRGLIGANTVATRPVESLDSSGRSAWEMLQHGRQFDRWPQATIFLNAESG